MKLNLVRFTAALVFMLLVAGPAMAACIRFQESRLGDAYLVNSCALDMNSAYAVTSGGDWMPGSSPIVRVHVAADERALLWREGNRPLGGRYTITVFSCFAPTNLVYPPGGRPTCQISYADAG